MENVNRGGQRASKHAKLWAKNTFDEWQVFQGFDMQKLITNIFENE